MYRSGKTTRVLFRRPEYLHQEAQSKLEAAEAQRAEAKAKFTSDQSTFTRLKNAAATPGVVAGNDVEVAQQTTEADRACVRLIKT